MAERGKYSVRYSISFRRQVVEEVERGVSMYALQKRYGIKGGSTIQRWMHKFGKSNLLNQVIRVETMEEKDRVKHLEAEIAKLKVALADSLLAQRSLEVVIDEAGKAYKTDLKKSFGESASSDSGKSSV